MNSSLALFFSATQNDMRGAFSPHYWIIGFYNFTVFCLFTTFEKKSFYLSAGPRGLRLNWKCPGLKRWLIRKRSGLVCMVVVAYLSQNFDSKFIDCWKRITCSLVAQDRWFWMLWMGVTFWCSATILWRSMVKWLMFSLLTALYLLTTNFIIVSFLPHIVPLNNIYRFSGLFGQTVRSTCWCACSIWLFALKICIVVFLLHPLICNRIFRHFWAVWLNFNFKSHSCT